MPGKTKFDKRITLISPEILSKIARIEGLKGQWTVGVNLNPYLANQLKRSVLITSTGASTRIEGAKLSDTDVEKLMQGLAIQKFADRDKQEVRGYFELLQNVFNCWEDIKFSENSIKHLHQELLKHVDKDELHRGDYNATRYKKRRDVIASDYKRGENRVEMVDIQGRKIGVLFDTTPAHLTPKYMQELVEWTQETLKIKTYHPLLVVGNFLVEFLNIHPFLDGNGRLSRILTNLLLLKEGYAYMSYVSHEKLIEDKKPDYYIALRKSQKTFKSKNENILDWLNFFLDIIFEQSQKALNLLAFENIEPILSKKQLKVWEYLSRVKEAAPQQIADRTKIARPTVNQTLAKLLKLKKVERLGLARSTRYRKIS